MSDETSKTCIICEEDTGESLTKCSQSSYERMKMFAQSWSECGKYSDVNEKLSMSVWTVNNIFYHGRCYNNLTHKNNLSKLKRRLESAQASNKAQKTVDFSLCLLCQEMKKDNPSNVTSMQVAYDILKLKSTSSSESLKDRLAPFNTPNDIFENVIKYHSVCLLNEKKKSSRDVNENVTIEDTYQNINNDFLTSVKHDLTSMGNESATLDMNQLVNRYETMCRDADLSVPTSSMKRYIKLLIEAEQDLMTRINFYQYAPSKPAVLVNKAVVSKLVCQQHFRENDEDEPDLISKIAKEVRKELSAMHVWDFTGTFDDFVMPVKLFKLIKSIISDNKPLSEIKQEEIDAVTRNIVQFIYSNFKSERQLNYQSAKNRGFEKHRPTPLSVGTALVNYKNNRSEKEIEFLSRTGLSINYDKLERTLTSIASTSIELSAKTELGVIIPSCFKKGIRPIFAADNIDIGGDVSSFHGADLMIVQESDSNHESLFPEFSFEITSERSLKLSLAPVIDENVETSNNEEARFTTPVSIENTSQHSNHFDQLNIIWLLLSQSKITIESQEVGDLENCEDSMNNKKCCKALSWSAFHSLLSEPNGTLHNVAIVAPLYRRSPTEMPILMDILKKSMNISVAAVGQNKRAIITLDGDLYGRAVKIPNYKDHWIIRLGSLHTVIAALKCLGKYIEGSGIDVAWESSGIYGSATVNQIIEGRHIYRGIQAHTLTLVALCYLKLQSDLFTDQDRQTITSKLAEIDYETFTNVDHESFINSTGNIQHDLTSNKIFEKLQQVTISRKTATFLDNYTSQIMNMLNYIGATRTKNWLQHLSTKDDMAVYFHAHDQRNYSKWALLYIADMLELESTDPDSWKFLSDGHFTVTTNSVPFTSIDPDHAIEHQHKVIKSGRGIADIKDNESAMERFALTMPILTRIAEEYKRYSNIKPSYETQRVHHELVGNFFGNQLKSAQNLIIHLSREGNPYEYVDLRNLMNFSVPRETICDHVCQRDVLGAKALSKFRSERMVDRNDNFEEENEAIKVPFWSPLSMNNFEMFSDIHILVNAKQKAVTTMKEEKQLYARMLFVSKTRPELCPEKVIGEYEFTRIPPSNFLADGSMILTKNNESLITLIMKLPLPDEESNVEFEMPTDEDSVVIVNAMDVLEVTKKRKPMHTVSDLENHFMLELSKQTDGYSEVRLIFNRFILSPLNEYKLKDKHLKKAIIHYHVNKNTPIKNIDNFLAHVKTRIELTTFLGQRVLDHFKDSTIKYLVAYDDKYFVNKSISKFTNLGKHHNFTDIKQIILSNVIDIAKINRNRIVTINTTDVDLTILLIGMFQHIPPYTTMKSGGNSIGIMNLYNRLGYKLSESIIGWYTFHGMKNQGTFYGKAVKTQFNTFLHADDDILNAFFNFGTSLEIPENLITHIERFVCMLYSKKNQKSIKEIRFLMSGSGKDGNQLPPTLGTLIPHISRAYYQSLAFKMSIQSDPVIPCPTNYHWAVTSEGEFVPVMCVKSPAPEAILELKKCGCVKTDCSRLTCLCRKNNIVCCALCKCGDSCNNTKKVDEELDEEDLLT